MPSPSERTEKVLQRLTPEELAMADDIADRIGASRNTAVALLLTEGYAVRTGPVGGDTTLPLGPDQQERVRDVADDLGITLREALELLILRGGKHAPSGQCWAPDIGFVAVPASPPPRDVVAISGSGPGYVGPSVGTRPAFSDTTQTPRKATTTADPPTKGQTATELEE